MKTRCSLIVALLGALAGCADTESNPKAAPTTTLDGATAGLTAIQSCGELESYVKEIAIAEQDKILEHGGYGYYGMPVPMAGNAQDTNTGAEPPMGAPTDGKSGTTGESTGPSHSGTNVQVAGVDEADFLKTDGNYLYVLSGRLLRILKSFPAKETQIVSKLELPYSAFELYLHGDTLLVYSRAWGNASTGDVANGGTAKSAAPSGNSGDAAQPSGAAEFDEAPIVDPAQPTGLSGLRGSVTQLTVVDVSDRTSPKIARTISAESDYISSRMVGSKIHTVLRGRFFTPYPGNVSYGYGYAYATDGGAPAPSSSGSSSGAEPAFAPPSDDEGDSAEAPPEGAPAAPPDSMWQPPPPPTDEEIAAQKAAVKANFKAALDGQSLADWAPRMTDEQGGASTALDLTACGSFYKPSVSFGLETLTIVSLDLASPTAAVAATTTLGTASQVYASEGALYAVSYPYDYWYWTSLADKDAGEKSWIHKFALGDNGVTYAGSGQVSGQVLNQFALDEHEGNLRVATTTNDWTSGLPSTSGVYVLAEQNGALETIGAVDGLAPGERLYSARFLGERGYVVTFKQVDPLFTIDLSNAKAPKVAGELKIPGFSTYIHPLDATHLLTIGRETFDNGQWVEMQGVNLQIFDVSDISKPTLAHKALFGQPGVESEALYDAKAFSWFPEQGLLALPYSQYGWATTGVAIPETSGGTDAGEGSSGGAAPPAEPPVDGDTDGVIPVDTYVPQAGVKVFHVDATAGITEFGTIDHSDLVTSESAYWRGLQVRRTVLIEDALYTVGTAGVKVNAAADLAPLASVLFPAEDACAEYGYCWDVATGGGSEPSKVPAP